MADDTGEDTSVESAGGDDERKPTSTGPSTTPTKKATADNSESNDSTEEDNSGEVEALQSCRKLQTAAESACTYTEKSISSDESSGMTQTCETMRSKGLKDSQAKDDAARTCTAKFGLCSDTCRGYARSYSEGDNATSFSSIASSCMSLASKAQEILDGGNSSFDASSSGLACQDNTSQSPQSLGDSGGAPNSPAAAAEKAAVACAANPTSAECAQAQAQYAAARAGVAGFNEVDTSKGAIDVGDTSGLNVNSQFAGDAGQNGSGGIKNGTIANNTGGGIPGGGGGANAKGGGGPTTALGAAVSSIVDIDKGLFGGGYAQLLNGDTSSEVSDQEINRALAVLGYAPVKPDIDPDLRRYLPGGDLANDGNLLPTSAKKIYGPGVDIWSRIHDRYTEKCLLGELYDCR